MCVAGNYENLLGGKINGFFYYYLIDTTSKLGETDEFVSVFYFFILNPFFCVF